MSPTSRRVGLHTSTLTLLPMIMLAIVGAPGAFAYGPASPEVAPAVERGVAFLKSNSPGDPGELALGALALLKAGVPATDSSIQSAMQTLDARFAASEFRPTRAPGYAVYEGGVIAILFANADPINRKSKIESIAKWLMGLQKSNGSWDYDNRSAGDTSITQYAILGLWEAANSGIPVPAHVWDRAAAWMLSVQAPTGSWSYHRDESYPETVSMTAAGVGTLLICRDMLKSYREAQASTNPLLVPLEQVTTGTDKPAAYKVQTTLGRMDEGAQRGISWIGNNFMPVANKDKSPFYAMYGIERVGALAGSTRLGRTDWFAEGSKFLLSKQEADGKWNSDYTAVPNTAWALMFLCKGTQASVAKRRELGAGTLLGGRGLPKDLNNLTVARGRVLVRPMNGAMEGMLSVLEDPSALNADSAFEGIRENYQKRGPDAIKPYKDRLVRMLSQDPDPGVRSVAAWCLGRTEDLNVAPLLINTLKDKDPEVMAQARASLQVLSRKIDGYGPPNQPTAEQIEVAVERWTTWYQNARPLESQR